MKQKNFTVFLLVPIRMCHLKIKAKNKRMNNIMMAIILLVRQL